MEAMLTCCMKSFGDADLLHCNVQRPSDQVGYFSRTASHPGSGDPKPSRQRQRTTCSRYSSSRVERNLRYLLLLIIIICSTNTITMSITSMITSPAYACTAFSQCSDCSYKRTR